MGWIYYHRNKIKDTLQGSVRRFEYHGHPPTKYQPNSLPATSSDFAPPPHIFLQTTQMALISLSSLPTPYYHGVWERMKMNSTPMARRWSSPLIYAITLEANDSKEAPGYVQSTNRGKMPVKADPLNTSHDDDDDDGGTGRFRRRRHLLEY